MKRIIFLTRAIVHSSRGVSKLLSQCVSKDSIGILRVARFGLASHWRPSRRPSEVDNINVWFTHSILEVAIQKSRRAYIFK